MPKSDMLGVRKSFVNILKHLRTLPLDEMYVNIDRSIEILEGEDIHASPDKVS